MTSQSLDELIEAARHIEMTDEQREEQRRSFAFGNANIENPRVTRQLIDQVADRMANEQREAAQNQAK